MAKCGRGGINKAKSRRHGHDARKYEVQRARTTRNTRRALARHVAQHPNDAGAKAALLKV